MVSVNSHKTPHSVVKIRKMAWVSTVSAHRVGCEKAISELRRMGVEELVLLTVDGGGPLYPSDIRPQPAKLRGKDLVSPLIKLARREGMRTHAWIVTLNFHNVEFAREHKDLYVVNKLGVSCVDDPPYVSHYLWLCPSSEEVVSNVVELFLEVASRFDVDGLHFDYIRYPDVVLPEGIRGRYEGVPREEVLLPRFDYCYCERCRELFESEHGVDPVELRYIEPDYGVWFRWRAQRVTELVRRVYSAVKRYDSSLEVSAAVFATPELAYRYVLQDWPSWGLDFYNPMIYHEYYARPSGWIGQAVREGVLRGARTCAGILVGFMRSEEELARSFADAVSNGASGICVFAYPPPRPELVEWVGKAFRGLSGG